MSIVSKTIVIVPVLLAACGDNSGGGPAVIDAPPPADAPTTPPPGIRMSNFEIAVDVTPDGRTAVFEDFDDDGNAQLYLVDTVTGVETHHGPIGSANRVLATGISADGKVTALHGEPVQAGVWSEAAGWTDLGSPHASGCDQDLSGAWDISADGATVIGLAWNGCAPDAFRWRAGTFTALQLLGQPIGKGALPTNRATVISDDGSTIAGFASTTTLDRSAAVWSAADGTGILLDPSNVDAPSEVLAIDAAGTTLAVSVGLDAYVWTEAAGMIPIVRFDTALPSDQIFPNAMTADGTLVFGGVGSAFFGIPQAFVWSAADGMRPLADIARAAGVDIPANTLLNSVLAASADGTVLIGMATENDVASRTFVLRLPAGAY
jgi:uncharacterized membrane protein